MSAASRPVLTDGKDQYSKDQNKAVVGWISHRLRRIDLGLTTPFPLAPGLAEHDRELASEEWRYLEKEWGNSEAKSSELKNSELVKDVNAWIERYLPSGNHSAGKERQKMLMTLRAVRASKKRRGEGALRFELDTELSMNISKTCEQLAPMLKVSGLRGRNAVQGLFIKLALKIVLSEQSLNNEVLNQVAKILGRPK
jgi:hypothetical protein